MVAHGWRSLAAGGRELEQLGAAVHQVTARSPRPCIWR